MKESRTPDDDDQDDENNSYLKRVCLRSEGAGASKNNKTTQSYQGRSQAQEHNPIHHKAIGCEQDASNDVN